MIDNVMAKSKRRKRQTVIYRILHEKINIDQHEPRKTKNKPLVNASVGKGNQWSTSTKILRTLTPLLLYPHGNEMKGYGSTRLVLQYLTSGVRQSRFNPNQFLLSNSF
jgi:hypothetical protein